MNNPNCYCDDQPVENGRQDECDRCADIKTQRQREADLVKRLFRVIGPDLDPDSVDYRPRSEDIVDVARFAAGERPLDRFSSVTKDGWTNRERLLLNLVFSAIRRPELEDGTPYCALCEHTGTDYEHFPDCPIELFCRLSFGHGALDCSTPVPEVER